METLMTEGDSSGYGVKGCGYGVKGCGCKPSEIIWASFLSSCLMQLVSNTKVKPLKSLSLQFVCNNLPLKQPTSFYSAVIQTYALQFSFFPRIQSPHGTAYHHIYKRPVIVIFKQLDCILPHI